MGADANAGGKDAVNNIEIKAHIKVFAVELLRNFDDGICVFEIALSSSAGFRCGDVEVPKVFDGAASLLKGVDEAGIAEGIRSHVHPHALSAEVNGCADDVDRSSYVFK